MVKDKEENDIILTVLVLGGLSTAFVLLFTDIGRKFITSLSETRAPTFEETIAQDPFHFYPYSSKRTNTPVYRDDANPYLLYDQPYVYTGDPESPYLHPVVADKLTDPIPTYYQPGELDPITEWWEKLKALAGVN